MKIFVYGWYGHGNLGDESYKESFCRIWPEHDFTFSDVVAPNTLSDYGLFILGGGDVVRPESVQIAKRFNCPKIIMSVTISDQSLNDELGIFDAIYVRDSMSLQKLKSAGVAARVPCGYIPDISLILRGDRERGLEALGSCYKAEKKVLMDRRILVTVNGHLWSANGISAKYDTYFRLFIEELATCADQTEASFVFLPFSTQHPWDDRVTNGMANALTKRGRKNLVIYDDLDMQDALDIISACDAMVTTRFHGLIFGLSCGVPTLPISFHDKTRGFCETIAMPWIDYYGAMAKQIGDGLASAFPITIDNEGIKNEYREKVHSLRR